jgi:hypothetical protein
MVQGADECELNQDEVGKKCAYLERPENTKDVLPSSLGKLILIRDTNTIQF